MFSSVLGRLFSVVIDISRFVCSGVKFVISWKCWVVISCRLVIVNRVNIVDSVLVRNVGLWKIVKFSSGYGS